MGHARGSAHLTLEDRSAAPMSSSRDLELVLDPGCTGRRLPVLAVVGLRPPPQERLNHAVFAAPRT